MMHFEEIIALEKRKNTKMDDKRAREILEDYIDDITHVGPVSEAIRFMLNQEPKTVVAENATSDCISRAETMTEIQINARRYTMAKEFGGMGQVEWSDNLISIKDALDILRKLPSVKQEPKPIVAENTTVESVGKSEESDCIDRAEAIKCLECDFDITGRANMEVVVNYINSAHDKIMNLPSVKQEPKTEWIPITEKLPEEGEKVLVWYEYFRYGDYNYMWQTYGIGWQYDANFLVNNGGSKQRVIAWCPLPKEYKESE